MDKQVRITIGFFTAIGKIFIKTIIISKRIFLNNHSKILKMKNRKFKSGFYLLCLLLVFILVSCSDKADDMSSPSNNYDIYICGEGFNGGGYWKNEIPVILDPNLEVWSSDIFIDEGSVYFATLENHKLQYWKNNIPYLIDSGNVQYCEAIYVENNNVHIAGSSLSKYFGNLEACYWKNGVKTTLLPRNNFGDPYSQTHDIIVDHGDVYITGYISDIGAVYWKNGKVIALESNNSTSSEAYKIFIDQSDIYICGYVDGVAVYWKNGSLNYLSGGVNMTSALSIFVKDDNIYIAGEETDKDYVGKAVYWKNGQFQYLNTNESYVGDIIVLDQDVYITGDVVTSSFNGNSKAVYWKNGVEHTLSDDGYATSIFAVKK